MLNHRIRKYTLLGSFLILFIVTSLKCSSLLEPEEQLGIQEKSRYKNCESPSSPHSPGSYRKLRKKTRQQNLALSHYATSGSRQSESSHPNIKSSNIEIDNNHEKRHLSERGDLQRKQASKSLLVKQFGHTASTSSGLVSPQPTKESTLHRQSLNPEYKTPDSQATYLPLKKSSGKMLQEARKVSQRSIINSPASKSNNTVKSSPSISKQELIKPKLVKDNKNKPTLERQFTPPSKVKKVYVPKIKEMAQPLSSSSLPINLKKEEELKIQSLASIDDKDKEIRPSCSSPLISSSHSLPEVEQEKASRLKGHGEWDKKLEQELEDHLRNKTSSLQIRKPSLHETLSQIKAVIQIYTSKEREASLLASVQLNHEDISAFFKAFPKLVENLPASFSWSTFNKGPISSDCKEADWITMLSLSCDAKHRRQIENDFVYQVAQEDKEKVNWPLVYELVRRVGFSLDHFKFNNSIKIRLLKLESASEEGNLDEIIQFLETKLPKDKNPFHIVGIELNKAAGIRPDQLSSSFFSKASYKDIAFVNSQRICDIQNNVLYLCLRNSNRKLLDLHGKQNKRTNSSGGRSAKQGREETLSFILRAYENFEEDITLVTGRGNHVNPNGKRGVLYKAFSQEWVNEKRLKPIVTSVQSLEGEGGYKINLLKVKTLHLGNMNIEDAVSRLKQDIKLRILKPQSRLLIKMSLSDNETTGNKAYKVFDQFIKDLYANDQELYKLLIPISFEAKKGELRLIFNKQHSRECFGDYFGNSVIEGTRGRLEN